MVIRSCKTTYFFIPGCFESVHVNGRLQDFTSSNSQYKVMAGCPRYEQNDPCESHMCKYGRCEASEGLSYTCVCRRGYAGAMCDRGTRHKPCENGREKKLKLERNREREKVLESLFVSHIQANLNMF